MLYNKIKSILLLVCSVAVVSCTDLKVDIESELTPENFPKDASQFDAATGGVYSVLSQYCQQLSGFWGLQEISTDAAILPVRDGNYNDGGYYRELHRHQWTPETNYIKNVWSWCYQGVSNVNSTMMILEPAPESPVKEMKIAQIRFMRALYYYFLIDNFGNVPIIKQFGEKGKTNTRAEVFDFIVSELNEIKEVLPTERTLENYARPTKWSAYFLLAKMYLNAEVYTGKKMTSECSAACDVIINSGKFGLDEDYISIFNYDNGPNGKGLSIKETIFAIWYDAYKGSEQEFSRYSLHPDMDLVGKYNLPAGFRPSNCMSTLLEYYLKYDEPEKDKRMKMWLRGKQTKANGDPIIIKTTKGKLDYRTPSAQANDPVEWEFAFQDSMTLKVGTTPDAMDVGKDILGNAKGIRNIKFWPDPNMDPSKRRSNNNIPLFRYADVLMMKAEAIVRGGGTGDALGLINQVRQRAGTTPLVTVSLIDIREERAREFVWEGWRRSDMIRFGEFGKKWELKYTEDPADGHLNIFPVPFEQLRMNPDLKQNPGYPTTQ